MGSENPKYPKGFTPDVETPTLPKGFVPDVPLNKKKEPFGSGALGGSNSGSSNGLSEKERTNIIDYIKQQGTPQEKFDREVAKKSKVSPQKLIEKANQEIDEGKDIRLFDDPIQIIKNVPKEEFTKDPIGSIEENSKKNAQFKNQIAKGTKGAVKMLEDEFSSIDFARKWLYQSGKQFDQNNKTDQLAKNIIEDYRNVEDTFVKNNYDVKRSAIEYGMKQDSQDAEKLRRIVEAGEPIPRELEVTFLSEFLNNPRVRELTKERSAINNAVRNQEFNFLREYPEVMMKQILGKIAQGREDLGMNNWFLNMPGRKSFEKIATHLAATGELSKDEYEFFNEKMKPILDAGYTPDIDTPGIIEKGLKGVAKAAEDIPIGAYKLFGSPFSSKAEVALSDVEREGRLNPDAPKYTGLHKMSGTVGDLMGIIAPIGLGSKALTAGNILKSPQAANELATALTFYNDIETAEEYKNDNPILAKLSALVQTGIWAKGAKVFGELSPLSVKSAAPEIRDVLKSLQKNEINNALATQKITNIVADKILTPLGKGIKESAKIGGLQTINSTVSDILNGEFHLDENIQGGIETFNHMMLGLPLFEFVKATGGKKMAAEYLDEIANNQLKYKDRITDPEAKKNFEFLNELNKQIQNMDISPEQKKQLRLISLQKKIIEDEMGKSPDKSLMRKEDKLLRGLEIETEMIVDPGMGNRKFVEEMYNEELLPKWAMDLLNDDKGKFSPNKVGEFLKTVAQQANGLSEDWKPVGSGRKMETMPEQIIEAANERWKKEIQEAQPKKVSVITPEENIKPNVIELIKEGAEAPKSVSPEKEIVTEAKPVEVVETAGTEPPTTESQKPLVFAERPATELSFKGLQNVANEFGYEDVRSRDTVTDIQEAQNARNTMLDWAEKGTFEKNVWDLLNKIELRELVPTAKQRLILQQYLANKSQDLRETPKDSPDFDTKLQELSRIKSIGQIARQETGAALRIPESRGSHPVNDYADAMVAMKEATGKESLTATQKAEVEKMVNVYEEKARVAEEKLADVQAKFAALQAEKEIKKTASTTKRVKKDYASERKEIFDSIKKKWDEGKNIGIVSKPKNDFLLSIVPEVGKLVKSYVSEGITEFKEVVKKIYDDLVKSVPEIREDDIIDIIAGKYDQPKETKVDLELKLKNIANKNSEEAIKIKARIKSGDFDKKQVPTNWASNQEFKKMFPKEHKEALDALAKREDAKIEFDIAVYKAERAKRGNVKKGIDLVRALIATTKAVKSGIDDSAIMMQNAVAMVAHPRSGAKALKEHALDAFSEKRFRRYLTELHESPMWDLIEKSGLDITDPKSLREQNKEEIFDNNLLNKDIIIKGKKYNLGKYITRPFERAFTSLGNANRVNMFLRVAERMLEEGKTFESHPQEFKDLAKVLNTETGRGKLHTQIERASQLITAGIWSPRLMASRLNMLGISELAPLYGGKGYYAGLTPEARKMAIADVSKFIGAGVALMVFAGSQGAELDTDPYSPTFGTIKVGDKKYNAWGGFTPYVKTIVQGATGERHIRGREKEVVRGNILGSFLRSRLTPAAGVVTDLLTGKDFSGKPITAEGELRNLISPLSIEAIIDGVKKDGAIGLLTQGLPSFVGVGVSDERDFQNKPAEITYEDRKITLTPELDKEYQELVRSYQDGDLEKLKASTKYKSITDKDLKKEMESEVKGKAKARATQDFIDKNEGKLPPETAEDERKRESKKELKKEIMEEINQ